MYLFSFFLSDFFSVCSLCVCLSIYLSILLSTSAFMHVRLYARMFVCIHVHTYVRKGSSVDSKFGR